MKRRRITGMRYCEGRLTSVVGDSLQVSTSSHRDGRTMPYVGAIFDGTDSRLGRLQVHQHVVSEVRRMGCHIALRAGLRARESALPT